MKSALIVGITGQDGAYLAELLLDKGYAVHGAYRRGGSADFWRIEELGLRGHPALHLVEIDLADLDSCVKTVGSSGAQEIYNVSSPSNLADCFERPVPTSLATGFGPVNLLESIRIVDPSIRFCQAGSSEMFGRPDQAPQNESTPFQPRNPYAAAKLFAHWMTVTYRENYGLFGASAILFNHESPLRGMEFVTRKISDAIAKISLGKLDVIRLGNMDARRDWGFAKDYAAGLWAMLQAPKSDTYVLATGQTASVRDFVTMAAKFAGIELEWRDEGVDECALDRAGRRKIVQVDPNFFRPLETHLTVGDSGKASRELRWNATTPLEQICRLMVEADIRRNQRLLSRRSGAA